MPSTFSGLVGVFVDLIKLLIPLVVSVALLAFFWGIVKFLLALGGDEKAIKEGRPFLVWGTVALFVIVSIFGILQFIHSEFGFGPTIALPLLPE